MGNSLETHLTTVLLLYLSLLLMLISSSLSIFNMKSLTIGSTEPRSIVSNFNGNRFRFFISRMSGEWLIRCCFFNPTIGFEVTNIRTNAVAYHTVSPANNVYMNQEHLLLKAHHYLIDKNLCFLHQHKMNDRQLT